MIFWSCTRWPNLLVQVDFPNNNNRKFFCFKSIIFFSFFFYTAEEIVITITTKLAHVPNDEDRPNNRKRSVPAFERFATRVIETTWETTSHRLSMETFPSPFQKRETDFFCFFLFFLPTAWNQTKRPPSLSDRFHVNGSITFFSLTISLLDLFRRRLCNYYSMGQVVCSFFFSFCSLRKLLRLINNNNKKESYKRPRTMGALRLLIFINSSKRSQKKSVCMCVPGFLPFAIACFSTWPHPPARRYQVVFFLF